MGELSTWIGNLFLMVSIFSFFGKNFMFLGKLVYICILRLFHKVPLQ